MKFDFFNILLILGIAQGLFLGFFLFINKKGNRKANLILGILIIVMLWHHLDYLFILSGLFRKFPHFLGSFGGSFLLIGPLLFFYVKITTSSAFRLKPAYLLHLIPILLFFIYYKDSFFMNTDQKIANIENILKIFDPENIRKTGSLSIKFFLHNIVYLFHIAIYLLLSKLELNKFSNNIKNVYSNLEKRYNTWLNQLISSFIIIFILLFFTYFSLSFNLIYSINLDYLYILPMTILIYMIGLKGLRNPEIFLEELTSTEAIKKYKKSSLTIDDSKKLAKKIKIYMENEKPFQEHDLKLTKMAKTLNIIPNHLSQAINQQLKKNFFDFINEYRVKEAMQLIIDPKNNHISLLNISYNAGFNNPVSFNNYFKKYTGKTPNQFKKESFS